MTCHATPRYWPEETAALAVTMIVPDASTGVTTSVSPSIVALPTATASDFASMVFGPAALNHASGIVIAR